MGKPIKYYQKVSNESEAKIFIEKVNRIARQNGKTRPFGGVNPLRNNRHYSGRYLFYSTAIHYVTSSIGINHIYLPGFADKYDYRPISDFDTHQNIKLYKQLINE